MNDTDRFEPKTELLVRPVEQEACAAVGVPGHCVRIAAGLLGGAATATDDEVVAAIEEPESSERRAVKLREPSAGEPAALAVTQVPFRSWCAH